MVTPTNIGGTDGYRNDTTGVVPEESLEWGGGIFGHPPNTGDIPRFGEEKNN